MGLSAARVPPWTPAPPVPAAGEVAGAATVPVSLAGAAALAGDAAGEGQQLGAAGVAMVDQHQRMRVGNAGVALARALPAALFDQPGRERQEGQLAGRGCRREHADDEAAPLGEPPGRQDRAENQRRHAGPEADDQAPEQEAVVQRQAPAGPGQRVMAQLLLNHEAEGDQVSKCSTPHPAAPKRPQRGTPKETAMQHLLRHRGHHR